MRLEVVMRLVVRALLLGALFVAFAGCEGSADSGGGSDGAAGRADAGRLQHTLFEEARTRDDRADLERMFQKLAEERQSTIRLWLRRRVLCHRFRSSWRLHRAHGIGVGMQRFWRVQAAK